MFEIGSIMVKLETQTIYFFKKVLAMRPQVRERERERERERAGLLLSLSSDK
jgi:hypothetical protein